MRAEGFELIVDVVLGYVVGFAVGSWWRRQELSAERERASILREAFDWLGVEYGHFELEEDDFWIVRTDGRWIGLGSTYDEAIVNAWSRHLRRLYIEPADAEELEYALDRITAVFPESTIEVSS